MIQESITRIRLQDLRYQTAFILTEVNNLLAFIVVNHTSGEIHIIRVAGILGKESNVILQIRIAIQLRFQHLIC